MGGPHPSEPVPVDVPARPDDDIVFLTVEQVIALHGEVAAPQHTWGGDYLYRSLTEMAAAYLVSLTQNHAFENGNKRVAFAACAVFLRMNGLVLSLSVDEAVELTLGIASHRIEREDVVAALDQAVEAL